MPKHKNAVNFPLYFIVNTIEKWESLLDKGENSSQAQFAMENKINVRTFKSWLAKRRRGEIFMENPNQICAIKNDPLSTAKEEASGRIQLDDPRSTAAIVDDLDASQAKLTHGKGYHAKRRIVERLVSGIKRKRDGYIDLATNVETATAEPKRRRFIPCKCRKACGAACVNKMQLRECNDDICHLGSRCGNRAMQQRTVADLVKVETEDMGFGVVARSAFKKRQFVCEYVGEMVSSEVARARQDRNRDSYLMEMRDGRFIDAFQVGNISRFINHSCKPNCVAEEWDVNGKPRVAMFALKAIKSTEEVTFNYGSEYAFDPCLCKSCKRQ